MATFEFEDRLRPNAATSGQRLIGDLQQVEILSDDRYALVQELAEKLSIVGKGDLLPRTKFSHIEAVEVAGHRVLMDGDGLNYTPAMARAHASMARAVQSTSVAMRPTWSS